MYDFTTVTPRRGMGAEKWHSFERAVPDAPGLVPFSIADMEFAAAPEISAALRERVDFGIYGYTAATAEYLRAVKGWMERRHGWRVESEWIFQTYGVIPGINLAIHALTEPGDGVIIQPPVYPPFFRVVENTGRRLCPNPLKKQENGRYEMHYEGLEAMAAQPSVKLMLLCSPHNPVGRVWTKDELQAVADICSKHGVAVFSDEIHSDFIFPGHEHTVFATLKGLAAERAIVGTAASKTFNLAGLTTANIIVADPELRKALRAKEAGHTGEFTNYFGLTATQAAYDRAEGWLDELLPVLSGNYEYCKDYLKHKFPSVVISPQEGSYVLWADFGSFGLNDDELEAFFHAAGLWFSRGDLFGGEGKGFARINLACPKVCLEECMARLDRAAESRGLRR